MMTLDGVVTSVSALSLPGPRTSCALSAASLLLLRLPLAAAAAAAVASLQDRSDHDDGLTTRTVSRRTASRPQRCCDKTRQDKTRQDKTRQDKTRQEHQSSQKNVFSIYVFHARFFCFPTELRGILPRRWVQYNMHLIRSIYRYMHRIYRMNIIDGVATVLPVNLSAKRRVPVAALKQRRPFIIAPPSPAVGRSRAPRLSVRRRRL